MTTTLVSLSVYGGIAAFVAIFGAATQSEAVQQKLDVIFRAQPSPPPAAPTPPQPQQKPRALSRPTQTMPVAVPDAAPTVSEAAPVEAAPAVVVTNAVVSDAPPPPPKTRDPINLPENATPPVADAGNAAPEFPQQALTMGSGAEALVILKIVVDDNGNVASVKVMKGDEPFVAAALAAVRSWHYSPALVDGVPTAVFRIVKIPFRLRG